MGQKIEEKLNNEGILKSEPAVWVNSESVMQNGRLVLTVKHLVFMLNDASTAAISIDLDTINTLANETVVTDNNILTITYLQYDTAKLQRIAGKIFTGVKVNKKRDCRRRRNFESDPEYGNLAQCQMSAALISSFLPSVWPNPFCRLSFTFPALPGGPSIITWWPTTRIYRYPPASAAGNRKEK